MKIIVSYRRSDSPHAARGIFERFVAHFGRDQVFMDIDSIPFGVDYRDEIHSAIAATDVLIVVIGPKWSGEMRDGVPRIQQNSDPVRLEIAAALRRKNVLVVPLLVDGAEIPAEEALPEDLRPLHYRNAAAIDAGRDFHVHVDRVIASLEMAMQRRAGPEAKIATSLPQVEPANAKARPEPARVENGAGNYATPGQRLGEGLIDTVVTLALRTLAVFALRFSYHIYDYNMYIEPGSLVSRLLTIGFVLAILLVDFLYYAFLESSKAQGTLGKMIRGLRVVDDHGERLTFGRASKRWLGRQLSTTLFYFGFIMIITDRPKHRALHDRIASTSVVTR